MKIAVVGGGPGGLFFALLVKKMNPDFFVKVHERNPEGATFGFGIALHGQGWDYLKSGDRSSIEAIIDASEISFGQTVGHRGEEVFYSDRQPNAGVERIRMMRILEARCRELGVEVAHEVEVRDASDLGEYDLIVGADGVNSIVRSWYCREYGVTSRELTSRMAWYGVDRKISPAKLIFKNTEYGYFWCVAYPHSTEHSTFVAECEERAYWNSGLENMSPEAQVALTEKIFADELEGARILYNKSVWRTLPITRTERWSVNNTVLIGDALHSPHPSIGSGTRLSMDDAFALASAISAHPDDLATAFSTYRTTREPVKKKLVRAMEDSLAWYEVIGSRLDDMTAEEVMFDWIGRTGRMGAERIKRTAPDFYQKYGDAYAAYTAQSPGRG